MNTADRLLMVLMWSVSGWFSLTWFQVIWEWLR